MNFFFVLIRVNSCNWWTTPAALAYQKDNEAVAKICTRLNDSETKFPCTNLGIDL